MKQILTIVITIVLSCLWINSVSAYDCSTLPEWDRNTTYVSGAEVQYHGSAYLATATATSRDRPGQGDPWTSQGSCDTGGEPPPPPPPPSVQPLSIYGVWHCGDHYCDWSTPPGDTSEGGEFDQANHWLIERGDCDPTDPDEACQPSVNLVVLSFLEPQELLKQTNNDAFVNGIPKGMTPDVVAYFKNHGIRVMLSMGGVTYTQSWNTALKEDAARLAELAVAAVDFLNADGLEIDWENGTPDEEELQGIETFIDTYNALSGTVLTLDLAVGDRYLQELSRRAAADWLPNGKIDYINAMVPRGEPSTDQWQEHVDGKANYNPVILPKPPAKVVVSLWLTDGRQPNENCVDFDSSSQLAKAEYAQTVAPNQDFPKCPDPPGGCTPGETPGFLGYMFWAAGRPSARNVSTIPPDPTCEGGMGAGATHFEISPIDNFNEVLSRY